MRVPCLTVVTIVLLATSSVRADPGGARDLPLASSKLVGAYRRAPGQAAQNFTADKASTCGEEASAMLHKIADGVTSVTVLATSIVVNTGKPNPITFASRDSVMSNVVLDRDDRFTTAIRLIVLGSGGLSITYNKVERETADWCSETWAVMLQRN